MPQVSRRRLLQFISSVPAAVWLGQTKAVWGQNQPISLQPVTEGITLLTGAGGNIAILQSTDGLLMIDSGLPNLADAVDAKARSVAKAQLTTLINTHFHFDHVGGNERLGKEGVRIIAHENVAKRLSARQENKFLNRTFEPLAPEGRPKQTFQGDGHIVQGKEKLYYKWLPPAHTDGDTVIHFQNANVFHTGDLMFNGFYPFIDYTAGGSVEGMAHDSDAMLKMVDNNTKIIPGHGPMATKADLEGFRDMLTDVSDKITKLVKEAKPLAEVQAAQPTKSWDAKYGNGMFKPADWVRMIYIGKTGKES